MTIARQLAHVKPRVIAGEVAGHLAASLATLARFARGDVTTNEPPPPEGIESLLASTVNALYGGAYDPGDPDLPATVEPTDDVPLVLLAAVARVRIAGGLPVTARYLGALAGITPRGVSKAHSRGELTTLHGKCAAAEAVRWLRARGVPGYAAPGEERGFTP